MEPDFRKFYTATLIPIERKGFEGIVGNEGTLLPDKQNISGGVFGINDTIEHCGYIYVNKYALVAVECPNDNSLGYQKLYQKASATMKSQDVIELVDFDVLTIGQYAKITFRVKRAVDS